MGKDDSTVEDKVRAVTFEGVVERAKDLVVDIISLVYSGDTESSTKPKKDITSRRANLFMEALGLGEDGVFYAGKMYTPEKVVKIVSAILTEISLCPNDSEADIANELFEVAKIKGWYLDSNFKMRHTSEKGKQS